MNAILAVLRRVSLGAIVILILSAVLKGALPGGTIRLCLLASPLLYLMFTFLTWQKDKQTGGYITDEIKVDIPTHGFFTTLIKYLAIDVVSPVGVIVNLLRDTEAKVFMLVATYAIILAYAAVWFFVL